MARAKRLPVPPRTDLDALVRAWGADIDPGLLSLALVHRSYANEAGGIANNERLEFLGDSVLSIVIADRLYRDHPEVPESDLSRMRAATVSQEPLAQAARRIDLGAFISLGKGESQGGGRDKPSILSDTFEALIGATYLTHGIETARRVVLAHLDFLLADAPSRGQHQDWKTILVEYAQARGLGEVSYEVEGEGPDHQRVFTARVLLSGVSGPVGEGRASSKKHAENAAARDAMERMDPESV
ncbi:ribonuclease III [Actinomyces sp. B33]|uniref:ribonuclease III n=1 Tax=Actinomyces sp. B33 TaxID=2942131 RepID=UPI002341B1F9|nr:ribonuclease III [Actinomyces sp. B33]MDC4233115.1 ribonuclease III [Actinomyces sp. B33]